MSNGMLNKYYVYMYTNKLIKLMMLAAISMIAANELQSRELTLDSAIAVALSNNNDVRIAQLELDRANAAVKEAYGYAMPTVDFSTQFTHFIEKPKIPFPDFNSLLNNATYGVLFKEKIIPQDNTKLMPMETVLQSFALANSYTATLQLQQVLFSSTVFKGISSAGVYQQLAREALVSKINSTISNVKKAFYGALLSQEVLKITKESLKNAEDNLASVQTLYKQGMVAEFDAMRAEVQVENIRPLVLQMESNLETVLNNLKVVLGLPQEENIQLIGEIQFAKIDIANESEMMKQARENNPDLKTLKVKRDFDEALIDLDISTFYPTLAGFGSYSFSGSSDNFNFQNYRQAVVGLSLSINLFNGWRTTQKIEQGQINVMKTEESIAQLENFISAQIKSKMIELKKIESNIQAQDRNVELASKTFEIAQLRYKNGTGNQLEIENAEISLRQAKTNRLQSVYQYNTILFDINALIGKVDQKYLKIKIN